MAKTPTQSRKMAPPKKPRNLSRSYSEQTSGSPIMMLAKFITDRKDRKVSEKEQAIYKEAIAKLNASTKKPAAKTKPKEKPRSLLARGSYGK
jgi:hypothetical protein